MFFVFNKCYNKLDHGFMTISVWESAVVYWGECQIDQTIKLIFLLILVRGVSSRWRVIEVTDKYDIPRGWGDDEEFIKRSLCLKMLMVELDDCASTS